MADRLNSAPSWPVSSAPKAQRTPSNAQVSSPTVMDADPPLCISSRELATSEMSSTASETISSASALVIGEASAAALERSDTAS